MALGTWRAYAVPAKSEYMYNEGVLALPLQPCPPGPLTTNNILVTEGRTNSRQPCARLDLAFGNVPPIRHHVVRCDRADPGDFDVQGHCTFIPKPVDGQGKEPSTWFRRRSLYHVLHGWGGWGVICIRPPKRRTFRPCVSLWQRRVPVTISTAQAWKEDAPSAQHRGPRPPRRRPQCRRPQVWLEIPQQHDAVLSLRK